MRCFISNASGTLATGASQQNQIPGRVGVKLRIEDEVFSDYEQQVSGGAYGQTAIYSDHPHHVADMRIILLRMSSWMNYCFHLSSRSR